MLCALLFGVSICKESPYTLMRLTSLNSAEQYCKWRQTTTARRLLSVTHCCFTVLDGDWIMQEMKLRRTFSLKEGHFSHELKHRESNSTQQCLSCHIATDWSSASSCGFAGFLVVRRVLQLTTREI